MKITSQTIKKRLGFSRQQLYYWRQVGIISPSQRTLDTRGHYRYDFQDFNTLKTIKKLHQSGFSTYNIRKCFGNLKKHFPQVQNPFAGKPVFVFNKRIIFVYEGSGYDALTMQVYLIDFKRMKGWATEVDRLQKTLPHPDMELILHITSDNSGL